MEADQLRVNGRSVFSTLSNGPISGKAEKEGSQVQVMLLCIIIATERTLECSLEDFSKHPLPVMANVEPSVASLACGKGGVIFSCMCSCRFTSLLKKMHRYL